MVGGCSTFLSLALALAHPNTATNRCKLLVGVAKTSLLHLGPCISTLLPALAQRHSGAEERRIMGELLRGAEAPVAARPTARSAVG